MPLLARYEKKVRQLKWNLELESKIVANLNFFLTFEFKSMLTRVWPSMVVKQHRIIYKLYSH